MHVDITGCLNIFFRSQFNLGANINWIHFECNSGHNLSKVSIPLHKMYPFYFDRKHIFSNKIINYIIQTIFCSTSPLLVTPIDTQYSHNILGVYLFCFVQNITICDVWDMTSFISSFHVISCYYVFGLEFATSHQHTVIWGWLVTILV